MYHNSNKCYKCYMHKKALDSISSKCEARDDSENIESDHDRGVEQVIWSAHSSRSHSSAATPCTTQSRPVDPNDLNCIVCGQTQVQLKSKRVRSKFRICKEDKAITFLEAANAWQDEVFIWVADLKDANDVCGADLYTHLMAYPKRRFMWHFTSLNLVLTRLLFTWTCVCPQTMQLRSLVGMKRFDSNSHHSIDYRLQTINRYHFWHRVSTRTKAFCEKLTQIKEINVFLKIFAFWQVEYGGRHFTIQMLIVWSLWC